MDMDSLSANVNIIKTRFVPSENTVTMQDVEDQLNSSTAGSGQLHCEPGALTDPLGLIVQALLAFIAFGALIIKRFCEPKPERRPWKIWFFDTSKQATGAAVIHFANVFLSEIFHGDPCTWYIVSFLLDSTVGLLIIYLGLRISMCIIRRKRCDSLQFGEYGNPPQCNAWVGQCGVYILVMVVEKFLMTLLVLPNFWTKVRKFLMTPIKDPKLELVIVMFIVPFIVNAFIFWVVDNFLKKPVWKSQSPAITSNETALKYFKAVERVNYYRQVPATDDSEADGLLLNAAEDEVENRVTVRQRSDVGLDPSMYEQHHLLTPAVS